MVDVAYAVRVRVTRRDGTATERWLSSAMCRRVAANLREAALYDSAVEAAEAAVRFGLAPVAVAVVGVAQLEEVVL